MINGRWKYFLIFAIGAALIFPSASAQAEYALKDKDVVVFLGDSITAARTYGKIVENYTLLRFPNRRIQFINAGHGGDTAAGGLARLDRDVFSHKATVLLVAYGVNDIGWGMKADAEHKQKYLDAIRGIVEQCKARHVRVFICSAAITAADPNKSENDFLQRMCDEGMALSRSLGESNIDVQRTMREIQKRVWAANEKEKNPKEKTTLHAEDGIHLNELGQIAMAFAILKGLGAPADVSSVTIQASGDSAATLASAEGCAVSDIKGNADRLEFVRLDEGLPINFGMLGSLHFRFIPIPEELNRYMLSVKGLPAGLYEIKVNDRLLGTLNADQLRDGWNISSMTPDPWQPGGDWEAQAGILKMLTDAEHEIINGSLWQSEYLKASPVAKELDKDSKRALSDLDQLQRRVARPVPYHFVIQKREK